MRVLRGLGWGLVVANVVVLAVVTLAHPSMTRTEILYSYWSNVALLVLGFLLLAFTERSGWL